MMSDNVKLITTPIPLPCGCVLSSAGISFCPEAKRLWGEAEGLGLFPRQAESAAAWQRRDQAFAAYKNHFEKKVQS